MTNQITTIYLRKNDRNKIAPLTPSQTPNKYEDYRYQIRTVVEGGTKTISIISGSIVGNGYYDLSTNLLDNQKGFLLKEPTNLFDSKAIAIYRRNWYGGKVKVGYVASTIANFVYSYLEDKTPVTLDDCGQPYFITK